MGAFGDFAFTAASAFPTGSPQAVAGDDTDTGLTRSRVFSRSASAAPKNSVNARIIPVTETQSRKRVAGKAIQRCHLRQKAVLRIMRREARQPGNDGTCRNVYRP